MMNVLPIIGRLYPAHEAQNTICTLTEPLKGSALFMSTIGYIALMGTTKVWIKSLGVPVDKTPATPFTYQTDPLWQGWSMMTQGEQVVVINNSGIDKPHYWDGGAGLFIPITDAPKCKAIIGWMGRLFCGACYDTGMGTWLINRIIASALDNITEYSTLTAVNQDMVDQGDLIQRFSITQSNVLRIYRNRSIWVASPTLDPYTPFVLDYWKGRGLHAPNSLQTFANMDVFLGEDDIYTLGTDINGVGWPIRRELFRLADPAKIQYSWSCVDLQGKQYYLAVDLLDGTRRAFIWNYEENTWTQQDITGITYLASWYED